MIDKELLKAIIVEGQELIESISLYDRPFDFEPNGRYVFVGIRQAGKSFMLYKRAHQLMAEGHSIQEIVYINFDDERLYNIQAGELDLIIQAYKSLYGHRPVFFFDEIQNITGWDHFARRLANQQYKVYITGSNSRMLSRDIATTLGGRFIDVRIFPYSFREYLGAKGVTLSDNFEYGHERDTIRRNLADYYRWGGFPELLLHFDKRMWLNNLYDKIILSDMIVRNGIKNEMAIRSVIRRLVENIGQPISYNRLTRLIKGTGISTSVSSVIEYVGMAKDACLLFTVNRFAAKFVERETIKKHYFVDNGLLSIFLDGNDTSLLENLCAITLHHYKQQTAEHENDLYFWADNSAEVDFYLPAEDCGIQVAYSLANATTRQREIDGLLALNRRHPLRKAAIVTYDSEETVTVDGLAIEIIPLWKWLLGF